MNLQPILRKVEQAIGSHAMLQPKDTVLVGVSGGPDSVALLHILVRLAPKWDLTLGVAHLDHGLRKTESEKDAQFVAALCKDLMIPFFMQKKDVGAYQKQNKVSLEMAGRHARYAFFDQVAKREGFSKVALGHHADDNAELMLINLLRGSGPLGITGIPPRRGHRIIRPLIFLKRTEIMSFLKQNNLGYVLDQSNSDTRFLRNRIRHDLLPHLAREFNPNVSDALNRLALIASAEEDWMDGQVMHVFADIARAGKDCIELCIDPMHELHVAFQRRILRKAIQAIKGNLKRISYRHIETVFRLVHKGFEESSVNLPDGLTIQRKGRSLLIYRATSPRTALRKDKPSCVPLYRYLIGHPGSRTQTIWIPEAGMRFTWRSLSVDELKSWTAPGQRIAFFDMDKLEFPLTVRNVRQGDRFRPLGLGGSQKVKKLFINNKVSRNERKFIPLLVNRGEILWVAGQRMAEPAKITAGTQNILKIELLLA